MLLAKLLGKDGYSHLAAINGETAHLLPAAVDGVPLTLTSVLHHEEPADYLRSLLSDCVTTLPANSLTGLLPPIDFQEVWAAGVTYKRSQQARMEESESGASHYDKVYSAPRPELFFKATPTRVSGPGMPVRVRSDSKWTVPEPELTLVISPAGQVVGYTIGNDMSARDIEGENPLYLPQAKVYQQSAALGPWILMADDSFDRKGTGIRLTIERNGKTAFEGATDLGQLARTFEQLAEWLLKDNEFPLGAYLMTGTGVIPPDDFSLANGDVVTIQIDGIGTLTNPVVQG